MISGLVTYCARQSLTSFASSREELRLEGVDIHLVRFREIEAHSWPLALGRDLALLWRLLTGRWDFLLLNSGASLLVRPRLLHLCLTIARKRNIPTFLLWRNAAEKFGSIEKKVGRAMLARSFARVTAKRVKHLAISNQTAREVERIVGCDPITNIHNCRRMPAEYLNIVEPKLPPVVLNMAGVSYRKAPDRFVSVAISVCARNPDVLFRWVGGAAPAELQQAIDDAGLSHRIAFIPHVDDPFSHMRDAYCLFLTSREEAFGLVLAEAMACARTVVSFAGTGAAEVPGDTGRVFGWDEEEAIVGYLDGMARKPPAEMVNLEARQRYDALYSPRAYAGHLASVIKEHL